MCCLILNSQTRSSSILRGRFFPTPFGRTSNHHSSDSPDMLEVCSCGHGWPRPDHNRRRERTQRPRVQSCMQLRQTGFRRSSTPHAKPHRVGKCVRVQNIPVACVQSPEPRVGNVNDSQLPVGTAQRPFAVVHLTDGTRERSCKGHAVMMPCTFVRLRASPLLPLLSLPLSLLSSPPTHTTTTTPPHSTHHRNAGVAIAVPSLEVQNWSARVRCNCEPR